MSKISKEKELTEEVNIKEEKKIINIIQFVIIIELI